LRATDREGDLSAVQPRPGRDGEGVAQVIYYRIQNWNKLYESSRSRKLETLPWIKIPTKQDGDGYTDLVSHPDGAAHLGIWLALVQVASKCLPRGTLVRSVFTSAASCKVTTGSSCNVLVPHDFASLSRITRLPEAMFEAAVPRLVRIGWVEEVYGDVNDIAKIPVATEAKIGTTEVVLKNSEVVLQTSESISEAGIEKPPRRYRKHPREDKIREDKRREDKKEDKEHLAAFAAFYDEYPRKIDRAAALEASLKLEPDDWPAAMSGLSRWMAHWRSIGWIKESAYGPMATADQNGSVLIPHPSTWLNRRRWESDPPPSKSTGLKEAAEKFRPLPGEEIGGYAQL
jgi:hypothetical protein